MSIETTSTKPADPKFYEAIQGFRKEIKRLATIQKESRLDKEPKSLRNCCALTVLHRLYLKIRNKPFEDVHRFNEHNSWNAGAFTREYTDKFCLDEIGI